MKFENFTVNGTALHTVTRIEISKAARNRTVRTNLKGDLLIDQGEVKRTVTINLALCPQADMDIIEAAVAAGLAEISFNDGPSYVLISATCASISKPRPIYRNGDRSQGIYYNDVTIVWEER